MFLLSDKFNFLSNQNECYNLQHSMWWYTWLFKEKSVSLCVVVGGVIRLSHVCCDWIISNKSNKKKVCVNFYWLKTIILIHLFIYWDKEERKVKNLRIKWINKFNLGDVDFTSIKSLWTKLFGLCWNVFLLYEKLKFLNETCNNVLSLLIFHYISF